MGHGCILVLGLWVFMWQKSPLAFIRYSLISLDMFSHILVIFVWCSTFNMSELIFFFFLNFYYFFLFFNILFIFERERPSMRRWGAEREGDIESEEGSRLCAVNTEPNAGLKLVGCEILTWAEVGRLASWATQVPQNWFFSKCGFHLVTIKRIF